MLKKEFKLKFILTILMLAAIAPTSKAQNVSFDAPLDQVWAATIDTVAADHFTVQSSDKESGAIWLKEMKAFQPYGRSQVDAIKRYTNKKVGAFSDWRGINIGGNITVKELSAGKTEVACHFTYSGYNETFKQWQQLESNNFLEDAIFKGVADRLPGISAQRAASSSAQPANGSVDSIGTAQSTLEKLRKVDAAFKIDAGPDAITSSLIEAQAQFDEFSAQPASTDVSQLKKQFDDALDAFKKARTATNQDRDKLLGAARSALASASETIQLLKSEEAGERPPQHGR
jgi:hypothetical protein